MRLSHEFDSAEVWWRPVRRTPQQLGKREHSSRDISDPGIFGHEFGRVAAPNCEAGGFQADDRRSRRDVGMQNVQGRATKTNQIRITIHEARDSPLIAEVGLYVAQTVN